MATTILNLFQRSFEKPPYGEYFTTAVYGLPPEFGDYLLRVVNVSSLRDYLNASTVLTPVDFHVKGNFGQPVFEVDRNCRLVRKKPEISIREFIERRTRDYLSQHGGTFKEAEMHAREQLVEHMNQRPDAHLLGVLRQARHLLERGIRIDFATNNFMLSENGIGIIDIDNGEFDEKKIMRDYEEPCEGDRLAAFYVPRLAFALTSRYPAGLFPAETATLYDRLWRLNRLVEREDGPMEKIEFRPPCKIDRLATLPLSATPARLREALQELEHYFGKSIR